MRYQFNLRLELTHHGTDQLRPISGFGRFKETLHPQTRFTKPRDIDSDKRQVGPMALFEKGGQQIHGCLQVAFVNQLDRSVNVARRH